MKRALITGITGQDGSYLAELLLQKGYEVHGIIRRSSSFNTARIDEIYQDPHEENRRLILHYGDLNDASSLNRILRLVDPEEAAEQQENGLSAEDARYAAQRAFGNVMLVKEEVREIWGWMFLDRLTQA